ncbi:hypothetical protein [Candidatus Entotheonella palauensis]|uniref:hypothetical protein n=1 Tax=Candidatus Entotheonella palauensis TaxID=93172 RepID=UPI000B7CE6EE|nr:hypothetical protein [Candidatus Entotheonella palauensis]
MRYEVTTSWTPEEVIEYALDYFGPGQTGLEVTSQTPQGVVFQGGGGYVAIQTQLADNTTVDIETREWDYPVHQFMSRVGRRRWWSNWRWWRRSKPSAPNTRASESVNVDVNNKPIFPILNNQDRNHFPR